MTRKRKRKHNKAYYDWYNKTHRAEQLAWRAANRDHVNALRRVNYPITKEHRKLLDAESLAKRRTMPGYREEEARRKAIQGKKYYEKAKAHVLALARQWKIDNRERYATYLEASRETTRVVMAANRYGLTSADYHKLLSDFPSCGICSTTQLGSNDNYLHIDHDHMTRRVRGLLCLWCNHGVSQFNDSPDVLLAAVFYLEKRLSHGVCPNQSTRRRRELRIRLLKEQHDKCAICNVTISGPSAQLDHDHATGLVRGMLCYKCNFGLGSFRDSSDYLTSAILYLERQYQVRQLSTESHVA